MKLCLLSFEYPPETGFGGIGTYTWHQARALVRLGHEVHVIAGSRRPGSRPPVEEAGVVIHRYRSGFAATVLAPLAAGLQWTRNRMETAWSMNRALGTIDRCHSFDLIEMPDCGGEGALLAPRFRERSLVRLHSPAALILPYYPVNPVDRWLCGRVESVGIRGAAAHTTASRFLAELAASRLGVRRPIRIIPNGVDLTAFDAGEQFDFRPRFGIPRDRPVVLFCGRLERRKGIDLCPEIAAAILERHEVAFVFAGRDPHRFADRILLPWVNARRLRGSIHHVGQLDPVGIRSALCQSDIVLIPSRWESCPYSCLEAMAASRAIVCSDQGSLPELIRDDSDGLLARDGNPGSYISQLERLLADRGLRERLGENARRTVAASFTDLGMAEASVRYYRECLAARDRIAESGWPEEPSVRA